VFTHYALRPGTNKFANIEKSENKELIDRIFAEVDADLIFYGHNHFSSDITGRVRYVNPGSLGCSSDIAISRFIIIDFHNSSYELRHFNIPYNDDYLFNALDERQVPDRDNIRNIFFRRAL
jgi:predicted phosphodiesterase